MAFRQSFAARALSAAVGLGAALGIGFTAHTAYAETDADKEIAKFREMLSDPFANPALLWVDEGEALWKKPAGTKNVSLETCDLGEGPGKLEGAYAKLPRYFKDADKVMDLETRLLWCMENIQGADTAEIRKKPFGSGTSQKKAPMETLVAYVASQSTGKKFDLKLDHPKEKEAYALGKELFYRRSSLMDFSCATCHAEDNKRIRLQGLPNMSKAKDAGATMGSWPTYRISQSTVRTMQHRMWDCYWQMRMPDVAYGSDVTVALITFMTHTANGGEINVPSLKR